MSQSFAKSGSAGNTVAGEQSGAKSNPQLEKLPKGQPKAAEGLSPVAFHRQHPEGNQGARHRATAQMGNVKTPERLRETETVPHGRTSRSCPICSQNELKTTTFCGCCTQNRPRKLCHAQHWHGPCPVWPGCQHCPSRGEASRLSCDA